MTSESFSREAVRRAAGGTVFAALAALAAGLSAGVPPAAGPSASTMAIFVDPDVRVSHDGDVVHMEAYVAASATKPDLLVAGGELLVPGRGSTATEARLYRSTDAGASWTFVPLPDEVNGGWDNAVAGGAGDAAYFLTSNLDRGLTLYSTSDGGKTWNPAILSGADGWDRPHIAVDVGRGTSPYGGRIYVAGEGGDGVRVITSADGGRTFTPPVSACPHATGWNAATDASPLVLSDGTLLVPCGPYPSYPARTTWSAADVGLVSSRDGGRTFSASVPVGVVHRLVPSEMYRWRVLGDVLLSGNFMQGPSFAVAPPGSPFADRIFAAWQDVDSKLGSRLLISWSGDRGATWSSPRRVDAGTPPGGDESKLRQGFGDRKVPDSKQGFGDRKVPDSKQGVPMLAVNREGTVGVAWFDGRAAADGKGYDVYFSASVDGGVTFLPAVRVSSATSRPARGANVVPAPRVDPPSPAGEIVVTMTTPFSQRATGGDYSSMAADAEGRFHPLWADARDGAWQLYSATIRVLDRRKVAALAREAALEKAPRPCALDSGRIQLLFGEPAWDASRSEVDVPVRLRNSSPRVIAEPIRIRASLELPKASWTKVVPDAEKLLPSMLDPATLLFPITAEAPLFPNGVTGPLHWRLRAKSPDFMEFSIRAVAMSPACPEP